MSAIPDPSTAAEQARARLHEEIERVRVGVEEMLAEQEAGGRGDEQLRLELDRIREETRRYVKKRVRKAERRLDNRVDELERRIDQIEQERQYTEWRIHTTTEQMLDGVLREIKAIADLLTHSR